MNLNLIKKLCSLDDKKLRNLLIKYLYNMNYNPKVSGKAIYAEGELPICLIAHMDTVFFHCPEEDDFYYDSRRKVLWSPNGSGFDDRAGIYAIIQILEAGYRPSIIFLDEEEKGGIGARELITIEPVCPFRDCKALIELDRANKNDSVYYGCDNIDFEKYINKYGFVTDTGTFSDISIIAPAWEIAAVNLSIGYEDEHSRSERLHCNWCDQTIKKVINIVKDSPNMMSYQYIPFNYAKMYPWIEEDKCLYCDLPLKNNDYVIINDGGLKYKLCLSCYKTYQQFSF